MKRLGQKTACDRIDCNWRNIRVDLEELHTQLTDAGTEEKEKFQTRMLNTYIFAQWQGQ